jgi:hypothetical protein
MEVHYLSVKIKENSQKYISGMIQNLIKSPKATVDKEENIKDK